MKSCLYCHTNFEPKNPKGKFCSNKCRLYHSRGVVRKPNLMAEPSPAESTSAPPAQLAPWAGHPELRGGEKPSKRLIPKHLLPEFLATLPRVFTKDLPVGRDDWKTEQEEHAQVGTLKYRIRKIRERNEWLATTPNPLTQRTYREDCESWLAKGGYDPKLAAKLEPRPPSPVRTEAVPTQ